MSLGKLPLSFLSRNACLKSSTAGMSTVAVVNPGVPGRDGLENVRLRRRAGWMACITGSVAGGHAGSWRAPCVKGRCRERTPRRQQTVRSASSTRPRLPRNRPSLSCPRCYGANCVGASRASLVTLSLTKTSHLNAGLGCAALKGGHTMPKSTSAVRITVKAGSTIQASL